MGSKPKQKCIICYSYVSSPLPIRLSRHMPKLGFPTRRAVLSRGTKGQKFLYSPGTKRQWDKIKIFIRDGPGRNFDILPRDGSGWTRMEFWHFANGRDFDSLSQNIMGQPQERRKKRVKELQLKKNWENFWLLLMFFWFGTSQDREVCHGIFNAALVPE